MYDHIHLTYRQCYILKNLGYDDPHYHYYKTPVDIIKTYEGIIKGSDYLKLATKQIETPIRNSSLQPLEVIIPKPADIIYWGYQQYNISFIAVRCDYELSNHETYRYAIVKTDEDISMLNNAFKWIYMNEYFDKFHNHEGMIVSLSNGLYQDWQYAMMDAINEIMMYIITMNIHQTNTIKTITEQI